MPSPPAFAAQKQLFGTSIPICFIILSKLLLIQGYNECDATCSLPTLIMCVSFYRNDEVRKYRNIEWQGHKEVCINFSQAMLLWGNGLSSLQVLDPTYTPIDVSPHKKVSITPSFELSEYENIFDPPSVLSEEPHYTNTPGPNSMLEPLEKVDKKVENDDEDEDFHTMTDFAIDDGFLRQNKYSGVSFHLTDSGASVYKAVSYIESTETDVPSLSCDFPAEAYLHHDACLTVDALETMPTSPYINDCPSSAKKQSGSSCDITVTVSHDSLANVSLAFDGAMHTTAMPHSTSYVCDSSDVPLTESSIIIPSLASTSSPELSTAVPSSELSHAKINVMLEQNTTPYIISEQLQSLHYALPNDRKCSNEHYSRTSSDYKLHFTAPKNEKIDSHQSSPHDISPSNSYKIQDLGGGYVDIMQYNWEYDINFEHEQPGHAYGHPNITIIV